MHLTWMISPFSKAVYRSRYNTQDSAMRAESHGSTLSSKATSTSNCQEKPVHHVRAHGRSLCWSLMH